MFPCLFIIIPPSCCRWRLFPRVLRDVSKVDMSTTVLGQSVSMPVCVAATAMQRMAHPEGETATARGETFCLGHNTLNAGHHVVII